jgi:succinate dehydrogenase / fumarate reductase flavoprotein subunit/fumarate reductase (CoM/CoB) subunit A
MRRGLAHVAVVPGQGLNPALADWFELRASLVAAEAVARAALARRDSRGAPQREDFPETDPAWQRNQRVTMAADGAISVRAE